MTRVLLQPAADKNAKANWPKTITHTVALARVRPWLDKQQNQGLASAFPSGSARFWGSR